MPEFIPDGYCDFKAALDAVGRHLCGDAWDWQEPETVPPPPPADWITGSVSFADAARLREPQETAGPSDPALLDRALDWLRQRLFKGRLIAYVMTGTGEIKEVPHAEWGTDNWDRAISSGTVEFMENWGPIGGPMFPGTISGTVLFLIADIEDAFLSKRQATIAAEQRCQLWLADQMRESGPSKTKTEYQQEASSLFGVGRRPFDRAWANAITETGNTDWNKPGPKSQR